MVLASINPATGETKATFDELSPCRGRNSARSQRPRHSKPGGRRLIKSVAKFLNNAAAILQNEKERWGALMTMEMGKTLASAIAEAEKMRTGLPLLCRTRAKIFGGRRDTY